MTNLKKIAASKKYQDLFLLTASNEHDDLFKQLSSEIINKNDAYILVVKTLSSKTKLNDWENRWGYGKNEVYEQLISFVNQQELSQEVFLSWVPEIFDECSIAAHFGDFHRFFSEVIQDEIIFQNYLRAVEPRIFSWEEWFTVIKSIDPVKDAEEAIIRQFLDEDHLERFQGSIFGTEWRMHFLKDVLDYCDSMDMDKVKHHCWKILADEAVFGMNAWWLISHYGYKEMMAENKVNFEKRYLKNATWVLDHARYEDEYTQKRSWELDFDLSIFDESRSLRKFLRLRDKLRSKETRNAIDACDDSLELLESLSWRYSEDPNLISNDSLIYESYRNIPKKILEELRLNKITLNPSHIELLKVESLWSDELTSINEFLSKQSFEMNLIREMKIHHANSDKAILETAKKIVELGLRNFSPEGREEFLNLFINQEDQYYPPKFFWIHLPSAWNEDQGAKKPDGTWISFSDWSGGEDWEPTGPDDEPDLYF